MPYPPPGGMYPGPGMAPGWGVRPPPMPRPHGIPSRALFLTGAVGHFIAAGMAIPFAFFGVSTSFLFFGGSFFFSFFSLLLLAIATMMSVALFLHLIGLYGLWKNYGSRLGMAAFIFGLIATSVYLSSTVYLILGPRDFSLLIVYLAGWVLLGVMFIMDGATFIVNRHFAMPGASIAAGVLFIIAGGFFCSILLASAGAIIAMPALIIGGIVLAGAPIPMMYAPPPEYAQQGRPPPFTP